MPGDSTELTFDFSDIQLEEDVVYFAVLNCDEYFNAEKPLVNLTRQPFIITPTGIGTPTTPIDVAAPYYNLQGMPIVHPKQRGVYIHRRKVVAIP